MSESLGQRLTRLGDEAEAGEVDQTMRPIPPHVKVSRPNQARSKVLQVRLNPDEFEAIERIAEARGLPASTVAREGLLEMIRESQEGAEVTVVSELQDVAARLSALAALVNSKSAGAPGECFTISQRDVVTRD